jgi:hypothetical protein
MRSSTLAIFFGYEGRFHDVSFPIGSCPSLYEILEPESRPIGGKAALFPIKLKAYVKDQKVSGNF